LYLLSYTVLVGAVVVHLKILGTTQTSPTGFLFLCPVEDFRAGASSFGWPDCAEYWSLDPLGTERLSVEEATLLGFPSIELEAMIEGNLYDAIVYDGLRRFHEAKGFDPESQELALHLGQPLYQLSNEIEPQFAYGMTTNLSWNCLLI
jgi:hypothetical protein